MPESGRVIGHHSEPPMSVESCWSAPDFVDAAFWRSHQTYPIAIEEPQLLHPAIDDHVFATRAGGVVQAEESADYTSVGREVARGLQGEEGSASGLGQGN